MENVKKPKKTPDVVFWGTSEFAIPALEAILEAGYSVVAVVTAPDKPAGRKHILTPPPVKAWIVKHQSRNTIPVLQPEKLVDEYFKSQIINLKSEIFIVAAYGKMIPANILAIPKYGALNIHPSLLPRWRGPSPVQYTILNGDTETGVTIMRVDEKIDHGPILARRELGISNFKFPIFKMTYSELHDTLAELGAKLLIEIMPKYLAGEIAPIPQDESWATYSKLLKKEDGHIDWSYPAEKIERMVRAFHPWPGAYAFWNRNGKKLKIDIVRAQIPDAERQTLNVKSSGMVEKCGENLCVQTGDKLLEIIELQLEGKKMTSAKSFLNGHPDIIGTILV